MIRVEIKPELLSWARERAGFDPARLRIGFRSSPRGNEAH
jgi:hypothetical protein